MKAVIAHIVAAYDRCFAAEEQFIMQKYGTTEKIIDKGEAKQLIEKPQSTSPSTAPKTQTEGKKD